MALTPKQERFVAEYLVDCNATQAAIRSGYSPKTANEQGARLLAKDSVAVAVAEGRRRLIAKVEVTAEQVITEVARIAFSDIRELFDKETGKLLDISALSENAARSVASVEVTREKTTRSTTQTGDAVTETDTQEALVKIRVWDKPRALELMARCLGMLKERVDHSGDLALTIKKIVHEHHGA